MPTGTATGSAPAVARAPQRPPARRRRSQQILLRRAIVSDRRPVGTDRLGHQLQITTPIQIRIRTIQQKQRRLDNLTARCHLTPPSPHRGLRHRNGVRIRVDAAITRTPEASRRGAGTRAVIVDSRHRDHPTHAIDIRCRGTFTNAKPGSRIIVSPSLDEHTKRVYRAHPEKVSDTCSYTNIPQTRILRQSTRTPPIQPRKLTATPHRSPILRRRDEGPDHDRAKHNFSTSDTY